MKKKVFALSTILLLLMLALVNLTGAAPATQDEVIFNIMDIVAADDRFDVLETAVKEADLADTLASADNTYTVFAPTDDAFAALPAGTLDSLLADPEGALTQVLLYHVLSGPYYSGDVVTSANLTAVQGGNLDVTVNNDGSVYINDSQIVVTDIQAKNGVIHVIDAVLVPASVAAPAPAEEAQDEAADEESEMEAEDAADETDADEADMEEADMEEADMEEESADEDTSSSVSGDTIAAYIANDGRFDLLTDALEDTDLLSTLQQPGPYTLFAPTDAAFQALPQELQNKLYADPAELQTILLFHVVGDPLSINGIANDQFIPTMEGRPIIVTTEGEAPIIYLNGAQVVQAEIEVSNGVIHVIDKVMLP